MNYKYQYTTDTERQNLIDEHKNLFLIEEDNHIDGKFLTFSTSKNQIDVEQELTDTINQIYLAQQGVI